MISTDLSHYHDRATATQLDGKVIDAMTRMSTADLERYLVSREGEMCGGFPVVYGMTVARNLGATNGVLFRQADSGDVTGDLKNVVGYAAMGLYQTHLSAAQKAELIAMAKKAVVSRVTRKELPEMGALTLGLELTVLPSSPLRIKRAICAAASVVSKQSHHSFAR